MIFPSLWSFASLAHPDIFHLALSGLEEKNTRWGQEGKKKTGISEFPALLMEMNYSNLKRAISSALAYKRSKDEAYISFLPKESEIEKQTGSSKCSTWKQYALYFQSEVV